LSLYQVRPGYGAHVKAPKMAGFGTSTSSAKSWSVIASQLAHDEKILEALHEEDQKRIRASAPRAVRALTHLVESPNHRDHARGIAMVLDRTYPLTTTHHVKVERTDRLVLEDYTDRLTSIALTFGLDPREGADDSAKGDRPTADDRRRMSGSRRERRAWVTPRFQIRPSCASRSRGETG
jgi:hypothetical protein